MARFVLMPCRIREDKMVPDAEEPVVLDWPEVTKLLAPSRSHNALMTLRRMRVLAYVGLMKQPNGTVTNFLFQNDDKSNSIAWLQKKQPGVEKQIQALYRVDEALFDSRVEELQTGTPI